jgi:archaellum component FlaF (FlaF/FlaG flagellin family)
MDTVGDFNVTIMGMTGSFKVSTWPPEPPLRPAELVFSDLSIPLETVELWEGINVWTFKITVNVTNVGEQEGIDTFGLRVNGSVVDWRTVKLRGGESTPITFDVTRGPGFYTFEVDGLAGSFVVLMTLKPAEFVVSDLFASPEVEEGEKVTFSVNVTNIGETEGTYTYEFKVDGEMVETENLTLARGDSTTVSFEEIWSAGTYQVNVEDLTKIFIISKKPIKLFWASTEFIMVMFIIISGIVAIYAWRRGGFARAKR